MRFRDHVELMAIQYFKEFPQMRRGQALMNALYWLDAEIYNMVHGTEADCFYDDRKIQTFLETI
jgi:hypothetical protein